MGKKKKNKNKKNKRKRGTSGGEATPELSSKKGNKWILLSVVAVLVIGGTYFLTAYKQKEDAIAVKSGIKAGMVRETGKPAKLREARATLSPSLFAGSVAEAYGIAKEIPEVLDQLYCYCYCAENFGHKSLLTCYVDRHASTCGVCMAEAELAFRMQSKGKTPAEIQKEIDKKFGTEG